MNAGVRFSARSSGRTPSSRHASRRRPLRSTRHLREVLKTKPVGWRGSGLRPPGVGRPSRQSSSGLPNLGSTLRHCPALPMDALPLVKSLGLVLRMCDAALAASPRLTASTTGIRRPCARRRLRFWSAAVTPGQGHPPTLPTRGRIAISAGQTPRRSAWSGLRFGFRADLVCVRRVAAGGRDLGQPVPYCEHSNSVTPRGMSVGNAPQTRWPGSARTQLGPATTRTSPRNGARSAQNRPSLARTLQR